MVFSSEVISLEARSNFDEGEGVIQTKDQANCDTVAVDRCEEELNYVHILNKLLPDEIRVLAWTPVAVDFSARYVFMWWYILKIVFSKNAK